MEHMHWEIKNLWEDMNLKSDRFMNRLDKKLDRGDPSTIQQTTVQQPQAFNPVYESHQTNRSRQHASFLADDPLTPRFGHPRYLREPPRFYRKLAYGDRYAMAEASTKLDVPYFHGGMDLAAFLDWLTSCNNFYGRHQLSDGHMVHFITTKLKGAA